MKEQMVGKLPSENMNIEKQTNESVQKNENENESNDRSSTISAWSGIQINCSRIINGRAVHDHG